MLRRKLDRRYAWHQVIMLASILKFNDNLINLTTFNEYFTTHFVIIFIVNAGCSVGQCRFFSFYWNKFCEIINDMWMYIQVLKIVYVRILLLSRVVYTY